MYVSGHTIALAHSKRSTPFNIIMSICIQSPAQRTGLQMSGRSEMVSWADSIMPRPSWRSCGAIPRSLSMKHKLLGPSQGPQLWSPTRSCPHPPPSRPQHGVPPPRAPAVCQFIPACLLPVPPLECPSCEGQDLTRCPQLGLPAGTPGWCFNTHLWND